ncbi:hypothetical protein COCNU_01G002950 [Cocos nucifera]|uniref:Piezo non-specific cation channel R-Ras-binding domain-containing protein n=1 Tax=Cocos nucifera TaxID=13894 RepID=A0A8K0HT23_COCNU|nr:hypothetical protein COCNU_01G002950 [Cocos nucifera]
MFLSTYRSYGTYVAFLTILFTLYLVTPNYVSFGYLFFLLFWIIGRQLVEKTRRRLWYPLKVYATLVFVLTYILSISPVFATWMSKLIDLYPDLGFNPEASLLKNVWESLAVLTVMQLYSYERRQSRYRTVDASDASEHGILGFSRRFLIWHSEKILSMAVFYALLSSISAFGFIYLLGLIISSTLPKTSRIPSKLFLVYTGLLVTSEYLFQMWCKLAYMCPGQRLYGLSLFLGLKYFDSGFWGLESGLRGKVLVIVACTLQYNFFRWLDNMPSSLVHKGKWEEPCQLFITSEHASVGTLVHHEENMEPVDFTLPSATQRGASMDSSPCFSSNTYQASESVPDVTRASENNTRKYSFASIWGSTKESQKWNKKLILALRKERFEMQKTTLIIYMKFWMENLFKLRGLEINMIVLLLASFAVLNAISLLYIICLVACILLKREVIHKLWPIFVFLFASILILEYFAIWKDLIPWIHSPKEMEINCRDCWSSSSLHFGYCTKCWLGINVDDPRMLVSYYAVFIFSSFKLRSDHFSGFSESHTYRQMMSQRKNALVWKDLSFETKSFWTFLDYLRLYLYCHLLDIVLALILITGTLEYDVLHLGYLGFALVFFRMRLEILKKKNKIFKFLRMYNFALIVLSLAYQSPYLGNFSSGKCEQIDYIYEVIGFYKYDYGFRITSRSALVEIVIFLLVSMQSYIFCSEEFNYVARYLEAEQIGAMVREQEKRAARKTAQLLQIRKSEEQKRLRNLQVEKMKSEMLNLQSQLNSMNSIRTLDDSSPQSEGLRRRRISSQSMDKVSRVPDNEIGSPNKQYENVGTESYHSLDFAVPDMQKNAALPWEKSDLQNSPTSIKSESSILMDHVRHSLDSICEISELGDKDDDHDTAFSNANRREKEGGKHKENPIMSAVQLIGDGVSQVQSLGNQAVTNIVSFLNIEPGESDSNGHSEDGEYDEIESQKIVEYGHLDRMSSVHSDYHPALRVKYSHILTAESSITAKDGEWAPVTEFKLLRGKNHYKEEHSLSRGWRDGLQQLVSPVTNILKIITRSFSRYWRSLTEGSEAPPYFVQLSMEVNQWPEDGIQPEKIESGINELLHVGHAERCEAKNSSSCHSASRVRIQSIERSQENTNIALAVLEVVYASPSVGCSAAEWYRSLTPAADVAAEILKSQKEGLLEEIDFPYPILSVIGGGRREIDLYAYVFGADLAVFFLVAIFYQSVIKNKSELLDVYQFEDQFPKEFVFILMVLFFLIVLDRIIYLCSFAAGKVIFYLFNLVLFTYSVTEYAWYMEPSHQHMGRLALCAIYLTKSVSLALQALQIRHGIPNKSTLYRQFLTSKVTHINYLGFRLYRALPFLYELRCVLDWSCTSTSLTMYDWLKIYSSGNPTNIANLVIDVSVQIDIKAASGRLTLFQTTLCERFPWNDLQLDDDLDPQHYLDSYNVQDIQLICCQPDASTMWPVPPVVQAQYTRSIDQDKDMKILITWVFLRERPKGKEAVKYEAPVEICPSQDDVKQVLNGTANSFRIVDAYPRYFRLTGSGEVRLIAPTGNSVSGDLLLNNESPPWWSFHDISVSDGAACKGLTGPMAIVVSEETPRTYLELCFPL